jgi:hypothetical protein
MTLNNLFFPFKNIVKARDFSLYLYLSIASLLSLSFSSFENNSLVGTPTITITSPTAGVSDGSTTNDSSIALVFTLSEADINGSETTEFTVNDITVLNGTISDFNSNSETEYTATFTPTSSSSNVETTIDVYGYSFTDSNGDYNADSAQFNWTYDGVAPTAAITYSSSGPYTSGQVVTITATFSEPIADSPVPEITITGSGGLSTIASTDMTKSSTTVYTYTYSVPNETGSGTVTITDGTDVPGNNVTTTPTSGATFSVDNTGPTISVVVTNNDDSSTINNTSPPTTTNASAITATFTTSEVTTDFLSSHVVVNGGSLDSFSGSGTTYTAVITPSSEIVRINVSANRFTDAVGNLNSA